MISFDRFHSSSRLSQETIAFDADVRWEGRPLGHARNDCSGGMAICHRHEKATVADLNAAEAFATAFMVDIGEGKQVACHCLEDHLDNLASEYAEEVRQRSWLKRTMKGKCVYVLGHNVYTMNVVYTGNESRVRDLLTHKIPDAVLLNALPMAEADAVYFAAVRAQAVKVGS